MALNNCYLWILSVFIYGFNYFKPIWNWSFFRMPDIIWDIGRLYSLFNMFASQVKKFAFMILGNNIISHNLQSKTILKKSSKKTQLSYQSICASVKITWNHFHVFLNSHLSSLTVQAWIAIWREYSMTFMAIYLLSEDFQNKTEMMFFSIPCERS